MNDQQPIESWETGSTQPPKSRGGLIAVLLAAVIMLCGISTCLGLLNIQLSLQLHGGNNPDIGFSPAAPSSGELPEDPSESLASEAAPDFSMFGFAGQAISPLEQRFYQLPAGFWVTEVTPESAAAEAGIQNGDILLAVDGQAVTDAESLSAALNGEPVQITLLRRNEQLTVRLIPDEAE